MIEFRMKQFNDGFPIGVWEEINNIRTRMFSDFEFSYCEYRIGDEIYTEQTPEFIVAFQGEKLWSKIKG